MPADLKAMSASELKQAFEVAIDAALNHGDYPEPDAPEVDKFEAAYEAALEQIERVARRLSELEREIARLETLAFLTAVDAVVWFHEPDDRTAKPQAFCSDTFAYATADGEDIPDDQVETLAELWRRWQWDGVTAWVAKQRRTEPLEQHRTREYFEAAQWLEAAP